MSTRGPQARDVIAAALKRLANDSVRLSPEARSFVVGRLAAALKAAYPKLDINQFLRAGQ